jgi:hypothetical protein
MFLSECHDLQMTASEEVGPQWQRTGVGCEFNRSMQHTRYCASRRSVADEAEATDLLHGKPEGHHVGPLAERGIAPADCPDV